MEPTRVDQILSTLFDGDRDDATLPELVCEAALRAMPVDGVGLALMSEQGHDGVVAATDGSAQLMEELQFTLGEGPCIDASRDGGPVLQPDFARTGPSRWPMFGPALVDAGVAAIFTIPLHVGAIQLGALDLYRNQAGTLDDDQLAEALAFADSAVILLLHLQKEIGSKEELHPQLADALGWQPVVHQSTGMIAIQAAVGLAEALLILRARAFAENRSILDIARDVVARRLKFHPEGEPNE